MKTSEVKKLTEELARRDQTIKELIAASDEDIKMLRKYETLVDVLVDEVARLKGNDA